MKKPKCNRIQLRRIIKWIEQIKTIDKRRVRKYLGRMSRRQMDEIGDVIETSLGLYVPEEMEAP